MLTVGIETSGQSGGVALVEEGRVLAEASLSQTGRRHARTLISELKSLFERAGRSPGESGCIAVSIGPGSFTGLRVGVVCAKTFAYATGCRIVAVDTLEAIGAAAPAQMQSIVTLVDAMRGDVFHARYDRRNDRWLRSGAIGLANWRELIPHLDPAVPLTGPMLAGIPADQRQHPALPTECWQPTAAMVAQIGAREALAGRTADLWRLEPLYIRKSAAEEKLEQTQEH